MVKSIKIYILTLLIITTIQQKRERTETNDLYSTTAQDITFKFTSMINNTENKMDWKVTNNTESTQFWALNTDECIQNEDEQELNYYNCVH